MAQGRKRAADYFEGEGTAAATIAPEKVEKSRKKAKTAVEEKPAKASSTKKQTLDKKAAAPKEPKAEKAKAPRKTKEVVRVEVPEPVAVDITKPPKKSVTKPKKEKVTKEDAGPKDEPVAKTTKPKKSKKTAAADPEPEAETEEKPVATANKPKKSKKAATVEPEPEPEAEEPAAQDEEENEEEEDDEEAEEDDQTLALLKGFDSDSEDDIASGDEGFKQGKPIPALPKNKALEKKLKKLKEKAEEGEGGVVYIGHIPHGFHEHEMRSYFTQFGTVLHLRLSRSKKTGNSKHYGFIEFASRDVAKIVAETMDKYLMFGQILKCKLLNKEEVHPDLWIGADKRFKTVPWAKIEGRKLEMGMGREKWSRRIEGERKRRSAKMEKLKGIGYEFEAPELKGVDTVAVREKKVAEAIEPAGAEKTIVSSAGDGTVVVSEELPTSKKAPRGKKTAGKKDADAGVEVAAILTEATDAVKAGADALAAVEPATKANIKKRRAPDVPAAVAEEKLPKKSKNAVGVKDGSEDRIEESAAAPAEAAEGKKVAKKGKRKST